MIDEENGQTRKTKGGKRYQKKQKGKKGKIIKTLRAENKVIVEGVHVVKKHRCWNWNGCWKNIKNKF